MAIYKNVAGQKVAVYAHDTAADAPETGDAANITAQISLDGGATAATNDVNPTELDAADAPGIYIFDMAQAETNADLVILSAVSATADVSIEPVIIYTLPTWAASQVAQTADHSAATVWAYATRTLTANVNNVTIVSAVSGNTITVYEYDTWLFTVTDSSLAMTDYENLAFSVKASPDDTDANAVLVADITTGLVRIGQAAATNANLATMTKNSATSFTVQVEMSEVATKIASSYRGSYNWWLKGIDTTDTPDQGFTLITGTFIISGGGARQIL